MIIAMGNFFIPIFFQGIEFDDDDDVIKKKTVFEKIFDFIYGHFS